MGPDADRILELLRQGCEVTLDRGDKSLIPHHYIIDENGEKLTIGPKLFCELFDEYLVLVDYDPEGLTKFVLET